MNCGGWCLSNRKKQLTECLPREFANSAATIGLTEEVYGLSMIRINEC